MQKLRDLSMRLALATAIALPVVGCAPMNKNSALKPPEEKWRNLFDGQTLNGWTPKIVGYPAGEDPLQTFRAKDGVLYISYANYGDNLKGRIGHLFTRESFRAYRLSLEYRFVGSELPNTPPANSPVNNGVMFHSQSAAQMDLNQAFPVSVEAQLLGPYAQGRPRTISNFCERGMKMFAQDKLLPHCVFSDIPPPPLETWVHFQLEVTAEGRVSATVDGKPAVQVDRIELNPDNTDPKLPVKAILMAAGGKVLLTGGHIALQSEGHPVEFRNIRILSLE